MSLHLSDEGAEACWIEGESVVLIEDELAAIVIFVATVGCLVLLCLLDPGLQRLWVDVEVDEDLLADDFGRTAKALLELTVD